MNIDKNLIEYWGMLFESEEKRLLNISEDKFSEALTIPENPEDEIESELRKKLPKNYEHSDRIVRWYRNERKSGTGDGELKNIFIRNLANILDLLKSYSQYVDKLKKNKMSGKKIKMDIGGKNFSLDPVDDFDKIRRLSGAKAFIKKIGDVVHSNTSIDVNSEKYAFTEEDRKRIRVLDFTEHVAVWATKDYETTNKFVYHLWQNAKTLGRGDVYGDPSKQTPYCTHSKNHWDDYSEDFGKDYTQYWFLKRVVGVSLQKGDLDNPSVVAAFNAMMGMGSKLLIAMNDSGLDFLDRDDEEIEDDKIEDLPYGKEVETLNERVLGNLVVSAKEKLENGEGPFPEEYRKYIREINFRDGLKEIPSLDGCTNLTSVTIPNSVTSIGDEAFRYCESLTSVTIPNSVTRIGNMAFSGCGSLISVTIPDSMTNIGDLMFLGCRGLTSVTIPNSVSSIGEGAFYGCRGLTSVTIPNSVSSIGDGAFQWCKSLTSVTIPDSVTSIGDEAFRGCKSLTSVTIPNSVTSIGNWVFWECGSLTSVTIPDSVTNIGDNVIKECPNLKTIYVNGNVKKVRKLFKNQNVPQDIAFERAPSR